MSREFQHPVDWFPHSPDDCNACAIVRLSGGGYHRKGKLVVKILHHLVRHDGFTHRSDYSFYGSYGSARTLHEPREATVKWAVKNGLAFVENRQ